MKIHEYQARELLKNYGVPVPPGGVARSAGEAVRIAEEIGFPVVIKAQVLVGGRGKAGGVKLAATREEVRAAADMILKLTIKDIPVEAVLVAKAVDIQKEYYLSVTVDRASKKAVCIVSASGGVDIEELAIVVKRADSSSPSSIRWGRDELCFPETRRSVCMILRGLALKLERE